MIKLKMLLIFSITLNCSTITKIDSSHFVQNKEKSEYSLHIAYEYYVNNELFDQPLQINEGDYLIQKDIKYIKECIKTELSNSKISIDSTSAPNELELNIVFKNNYPFLLAFVSGLTMTLLPAYFDTDLEIQARLFNRQTKFYSNKIINSGKMRTYIGIIPLFGLPFSNSSNNRNFLIQNLIKKTLNDIKI
jgi:hypothetical protein